jgi:hypothetical protein
MKNIFHESKSCLTCAGESLLKVPLFKGDLEGSIIIEELLTSLLMSKGEDRKATVEVAHEALLRSWKVLQDLIREKEEIIVLKNRLYTDSKQKYLVSQNY